MKYICKQGFSVEEYDDDGWPTDKYMNIEDGDIRCWVKTDDYNWFKPKEE